MVKFDPYQAKLKITIKTHIFTLFSCCVNGVLMTCFFVNKIISFLVVYLIFTTNLTWYVDGNPWKFERASSIQNREITILTKKVWNKLPLCVSIMPAILGDCGKQTKLVVGSKKIRPIIKNLFNSIRKYKAKPMGTVQMKGLVMWGLTAVSLTFSTEH